MSGAIDNDTRRAVASGRETVGAMLSAAQSNLQKVFTVILLGLIGTIYLLRRFVWDMLKADLFARLAAKHPAAFDQTEIVAVTPFDVILLQVKIGLAVGIVLAIPLFIWYSRDALRQRGWWPGERVDRWKIAVMVFLAAVLAAGGIAYAYYLFFPLMFSFLASNAYNVGFTPTYSIVKWAEFVFLLTLSFALAAQLPLAMSALSYTEIVPYETFRDKWRHAVVAIVAFGALFSPPDPFTQFMWAVPLIILYGFSIWMAKLVTITRRGSEQIDIKAVGRERWNVMAGVCLLTFASVYGFFTRGGIGYTNAALANLPAAYRPGPLPPLSQVTGLPAETAAGIVAVASTFLFAGITLFYFVVGRLNEINAEADRGPQPASVGSPTEISLDELDAAGIRAAPPEVFGNMSEKEAVAKAGTAMEDDRPEKARAILNRFDEVSEQTETETETETDAESNGHKQPGSAPATAETATAPEASSGEAGTGADSNNTATKTAAGVVNAFTEEETTEEDIGGYYFDIAYILDSLTSKAFRIVGLFMVVLAGTFMWLYQGGIRQAKEAFFGQMPAQLQSNVSIVTLHPVEALIFQIKFSTILAAVLTLPLILYYAWPALKERGLVRGDPRVMLVWGGTLLVGIIGGSLLGFFYIAPAIISWLATDVINANMIISYRINNFGWLVIYTTIGVGLLASVPVSMLLFHSSGVLSYWRMRDYWRHVIVGIFALSALLSPRGVFTMFLMGIPAAIAYGIGLVLLWIITLGGRRGKKPQPLNVGLD